MSIEKHLKGILERREQQMQNTPCPMCNATSWKLHDTTVLLAEYTAKMIQMKSGRNKFETEYADQSNNLIQFDCMNCGFVALFKPGLGTPASD